MITVNIIPKDISLSLHQLCMLSTNIKQCTLFCVYFTNNFCLQDSELAELRATIEALKQQSGISLPPDSSFSPSSVRRQSSNASGVGKESVTPGEWKWSKLYGY